MSKLCIYHANCMDGMTAAWIVKQLVEDVELFAGAYGKPPPDVTGRDVIIVDFSYKKKTLIEMGKLANSIMIIDHHKTAQEDLAEFTVQGGVGNIVAYFDMEFSGASLTWITLAPGKIMPAIVRYVEDRDLWRHGLPWTREINAFIGSFPHDPNVWTHVAHAIQNDPSEAVKQGAAIVRQRDLDLTAMLGACKREGDIAGHRVPIASVPMMFTSDAGHIMCQGQPFAACYWDTPDGRVYSLRSDQQGLDVSEIAASFGGGGHKHAAGYTVPWPVVEFQPTSAE